jgi:hypothetical protein
MPDVQETYVSAENQLVAGVRPVGWTIAAASFAIPGAWQAVYSMAYAVVVANARRQLWLGQQQPSLN